MRKRIDHPINRTREDFVIETFRAGGKGGQYQNSTDTGVRIRCKITGLFAESREHRSQYANRKAAFHRLVDLLKSHYFGDSQKVRYAAGQERVRTYSEPDDRVTDHGTGRSHSYRHTAGKGDIGTLIEERLAHMVGEEQ